MKYVYLPFLCKILKKEIALFLFCAVPLMIILSCEQEQQQGTGIDTVYINTSKPYKGKLSSIFNIVDSVSLKMDALHVISQIDKIEFYKNKIYILDRFNTKGVYVYDNKGNFIKKLNNSFDEDDGVYDFIIDKKSGIIELLTLYRIFYINPDDDFSLTKTEKINLLAARLTKSDEYYYFECAGDSDMVVVTDHSFEFLSSYFPTKPQHSSRPCLSFTADKEDYFFMINYNNIIYSFDNTDLKEKYQFVFDNETIDKAQLWEVHDFRDERNNAFFDKKILKEFFIPLEDFLYIAYMYRGQEYVVLHNKNDASSNIFNVVDVTNDITNEQYFPFIIGKKDENTLISYKSKEGQSIEEDGYVLYLITPKERELK